MQRRRTLKLLFAFPFAALIPSWAFGADAKKGNAPEAAAAKKATNKNLIDENDTLAKAMQYRHDASKAPAMRTNKNAFCYNCSKYNVCMDGDTACKPLPAAALKSADAAPCQIFKGKLVAKDGWCLSWQAKG